MGKCFDDVLFIISTDCFALELLPCAPVKDAEFVKGLARTMIPVILNGGDNYYMRVGLSAGSVEKTRLDFMSLLERHNVSQTLQRLVNLIYEALHGVTDGMNDACDAITVAAMRIYALDLLALKNPLPVDLIDAISIIEEVDFQPGCDICTWSEAWENSVSEWDKYIMSLMDGIDDAHLISFLKVREFTSKLDFLRAWKKALSQSQFESVMDFIRLEANAELSGSCTKSAYRIDQVLSSI